MNGTRHEWVFKGIHNKVCRLQLTADAGQAGCAIKQLIFSYRNSAEVEYSVDATQTGECTVDPDNGKMKVTLNGSYSTSVHGDLKATGTALASNPASLAARTFYTCNIEGSEASTSYYFCTTYANCTIMTVKYELAK